METTNKMRNWWKGIKITAKSIAAAAVLWAAFSSPYTIEQTQHAVVTSFGNPVRVIVNKNSNKKAQIDTSKLREEYKKSGISLSEGAGLHFKLPWQSVHKLENRILRWDGWPEQINTKDNKYLWAETTTRYFIENPLRFYLSVETEEKGLAKLSDILDSSVRTGLTNNNLIELVRTDNRSMEITDKEIQASVQVSNITKGREKIMQEVTKDARDSCHEYGIRIHEIGVMIKTLTYIEDVKKSVEARMMSERERISERYISEGNGEYQNIMGKTNREVKTIISEGEKTAKSIEGMADAEATKIYAFGFKHQEKNNKGEVISEQDIPGLTIDPVFYRFVQTMGLYESGLGGPNKSKVVLGTDNPIMKYLKGDFLRTSTQPSK